LKLSKSSSMTNEKRACSSKKSALKKGLNDTAKLHQRASDFVVVSRESIKKRPSLIDSNLQTSHLKQSPDSPHRLIVQRRQKSPNHINLLPLPDHRFGSFHKQTIQVKNDIKCCTAFRHKRSPTIIRSTTTTTTTNCEATCNSPSCHE